MRLFIPLSLILLFVGWALYRLLVQRDLKQHRSEFSLGVFFSVVWVLIYWFIVA